MKNLRSKKGHFLLEVLLASGVLAILSVSLLQGLAQQNRVSTMTGNRLEALQFLNTFKSRWTAGNGLPKEHTGILKTGYPFTIKVEEDRESHPPLEKASITVFWKDPHLREPQFIQTYGVRIS